jgi:hypothetical protein
MEISLELDQTRTEGLEKYAALGNMNVGDLIKQWITRDLDYATIAMLRAKGKTWDDTAKTMGISVTQARRIAASQGDLEVTQRDLQIAVKYLEVLNETSKRAENLLETMQALEEQKYNRPSQEDLDLANELYETMDNLHDLSYSCPSQEDLDLANELYETMDNLHDLSYSCPSQEDLDLANELYGTMDNLHDLSYSCPSQEDLERATELLKTMEAIEEQK